MGGLLDQMATSLSSDITGIPADRFQRFGAAARAPSGFSRSCPLGEGRRSARVPRCVSLGPASPGNRSGALNPGLLDSERGYYGNGAGSPCPPTPFIPKPTVRWGPSVLVGPVLQSPRDHAPAPPSHAHAQRKRSQVMKGRQLIGPRRARSSHRTGRLGAKAVAPPTRS